MVQRLVALWRTTTAEEMHGQIRFYSQRRKKGERQMSAAIVTAELVGRSWRDAIQRVQRVTERSGNRVNMPTALLAALEYLEVRVVKRSSRDFSIPFTEVERRFKEMVKGGDADRGFYYLSKNAAVWSLFDQDGRKVTFADPRQTPPVGDLRNTQARFNEDLLPDLRNKNSRAVIMQELKQLRGDKSPDHEMDESDDDEREFSEGRVLYQRHRRYERSAALIKMAKARAKRKDNGRLLCEACGFDFFARYGEEFIEAHHTIPVKELTEHGQTKVEDIALVCSNCHRMLHRKRPWLTRENLAALLAE